MSLERHISVHPPYNIVHCIVSLGRQLHSALFLNFYCDGVLVTKFMFNSFYYLASIFLHKKRKKSLKCEMINKVRSRSLNASMGKEYRINEVTVWGQMTKEWRLKDDQGAVVSKKINMFSSANMYAIFKKRFASWKIICYHEHTVSLLKSVTFGNSFYY